MCIHPTILPEIGPVACRLCWQCLENRKNDYVGRCIAEQLHSDGCMTVALTYGGGNDNPNAALLVYKDFQDFMKRLRIAGQRAKPEKQFTVRYLVAGEYGADKGRAHWHAVLFFKGYVPDVEFENPFFEWKPFWPHGFSFFQEANYRTFAYAIKYALKDLQNKKQDIFVGHLGRSLKPPLGAEYFHQLAKQYVSANLAPKEYFYSFPDVYDVNHKRRIFMMQGAVRDLFTQSYLDQYKNVRGTLPPTSEMLDLYQDKLTDRSNDRTDAEWHVMFNTTHSGKRKPMPRTDFDDMQYIQENSEYYKGILSLLPVVVCEEPDGRLQVKNQKGEIWFVHEKDQIQTVLQGLTKKTRIEQKQFNKFPPLDRPLGERCPPGHLLNSQ